MTTVVTNLEGSLEHSSLAFSCCRPYVCVRLRWFVVKRRFLLSEHEAEQSTRSRNEWIYSNTN